MPKNIMVPLDGSVFSEQAIQYAFGSARVTGATLHFVRVHSAAPPADPARPWEVDGVIDSAMREHEYAYLERFRFSTGAVDINVRTAVIAGPVVDALADYVAKADIDQVIMTTHGRGGLSRVWLGSVADSLVRRVDVPVVLLRPLASTSSGGPAYSADHIVLPVDGSEWSERVVEYAITLGELTAARYSLVHVMAPPLDATGATELVPTTDLAEFRISATAALEKMADRLRARGLSVQTAVVMQTQVAQGIIEYALENRADLIAMATHGRRGWARVMLGSVADKVLRTSHVPLLLLPPESVMTSDGSSTTAFYNDVLVNGMTASAPF